MLVRLEGTYAESFQVESYADRKAVTPKKHHTVAALGQL